MRGAEQARQHADEAAPSWPHVRPTTRASARLLQMCSAREAMMPLTAGSILLLRWPQSGQARVLLSLHCMVTRTLVSIMVTAHDGQRGFSVAQHHEMHLEMVCNAQPVEHECHELLCIMVAAARKLRHEAIDGGLDSLHRHVVHAILKSTRPISISARGAWLTTARSCRVRSTPHSPARVTRGAPASSSGAGRQTPRPARRSACCHGPDPYP
jgi:hypothetical protein